MAISSKSGEIGTDLQFSEINESGQTEGDTLMFTGGSWQRLPVGADNTVLKIATVTPNWESELSVSNQVDSVTATESTTSSSMVTTTLSITIANRTGGKFMAISNPIASNSTSNKESFFQLHDDGVGLTAISLYRAVDAITDQYSICVMGVGDLDGSVIALYFKAELGGSAQMIFLADVKISTLEILEIG